MKTNFNIKEFRIGNEVRIENFNAEVIYTPQEFIETMKSLKEMFGTDIMNTIMKTVIIGNMK